MIYDEAWHKRYITKHPHSFAYNVYCQKALCEHQMRRISEMTSVQAFDWIWYNWNSSYALNMYDEYYQQSPFKHFDEELLQKIKTILSESNEIVINPSFKLLEVKQKDGTFYEQKARGEDIMSSFSEEKPISKPSQILNMFIPVPILGYYGFLKYHVNSIKFFAPVITDYYEIGTTFICRLINPTAPQLSKTYDTYNSIFHIHKQIPLNFNHDDEMIHIIQVKFYKK